MSIRDVTARDRNRFGKGAPGGIAASESANDAAAIGSLVPLFACVSGLGYYGDHHGGLYRPQADAGADLYGGNGDLIYAVFAGLLISIC